MRSDDRMAENIITRVNEADEALKMRRKAVIKTAGGAFAFALAFAFVFSFASKKTEPAPTNEPSIDKSITSSQKNEAVETEKPELNKGYSFIIADAAEIKEGTDITAEPAVFSFTKESDVLLPFAGILAVKDIRGMTPHEISYVSHSIIVSLEEKYGENDAFSIKGSETQPTAVYFGTLGKMSVKTEDASALESIEISCAGDGKITVMDIYAAAMGDSESFRNSIKDGQSIIVSGEEYRLRYNKDEGMHFDWFPSADTEAMLRSNPESPLSEISDTVTVRINYIDGTSEAFTLTLSFDEAGVLTMIYN